MSALGTDGGNQYTKAVETKRSTEQRDAWRERVDVGKLMRLLSDAANGTKKTNPNQIRAAEVLLDRLVPRLSSSELKEVNDYDAMSREDLLGRIKALLQSDPTLLPELVALQAREVKDTPANVTVVQPGPTKVRGPG